MKFIVGGYSCLKNHILISCIVHTPKNWDTSVLIWSWSSVCVCACLFVCVYARAHASVCVLWGFGGVGACMCGYAHQLWHSSTCSLWLQWSVITLTCAALTLPRRSGTLMTLLIINIKLQMFLPVPLLVLKMAKTVSCSLTVCWGCDV